MLDEHYLELAQHVDGIIHELQAHPDEETRGRVVALLEGLDLLHREGLVRLVGALRERGAGDVVDEAAERDEVVRILLALYDLAELDGADANGDVAASAHVGFIPASQVRVRRAGEAPHPRAP